MFTSIRFDSVTVFSATGSLISSSFSFWTTLRSFSRRSSSRLYCFRVLKAPRLIKFMSDKNLGCLIFSKYTNQYMIHVIVPTTIKMKIITNNWPKSHMNFSKLWQWILPILNWISDVWEWSFEYCVFDCIIGTAPWLLLRFRYVVCIVCVDKFSDVFASNTSISVIFSIFVKRKESVRHFILEKTSKICFSLLLQHRIIFWESDHSNFVKMSVRYIKFRIDSVKTS